MFDSGRMVTLGSTRQPGSGGSRAGARLVATFVLAASVFTPLLVPEAAAQVFGLQSSLTGRVHDAAGEPLAGALVAVESSAAGVRERLVFTDRGGLFAVTGLAAGNYLVRVTKARFLPAVAHGVELEAGTSLSITLSLQTALEVLRQRVRRGTLEDMKWVLRSSPSARPVLHLVDPGTASPPAEETGNEPAATAAGYLQLYSTAVHSSGGVADAVGSEFAFSMPVAGSAQVTFAGQYSEAEDRPGGFTAAYEVSSDDRKRTSVELNMRQGALLDSAYGRQVREVQLNYDEQLQWTDHLVFTYGASVGRTAGPSAESAARSYMRPEVGVTWVPDERSTISASYSRQAPVDASDAIRGREYFDRTVYIPPELDTYSHFELAATRWVGGNTQVSVAGFRDALGTQAFLVDADDGRRGIVFFDGTDSPTAGVRLYVDRAFRRFEAGVGYTYASAAGFDPDVVSPDELRSDASRRGVHMVTARVQTEIDRTQTAVTAVYRWISGFSLAPVDPYQRFAEYNDPTLSITVAQGLPSIKILPARWQAIVDARNLLEPSFGSRRTVYAGSPRLLKGGIHIQF